MNKILEEIISRFGEENQKKKAIEELSELIIAITKNDKKNITEEIADIWIMVNQLKIIYNIKTEEIEKISKYKIKRTLKFMENNLSFNG